MLGYSILLLTFLTFLAVLTSAERGDVYKIGVGIADITGPAAEINMVRRHLLNSLLCLCLLNCGLDCGSRVLFDDEELN